MQRINPETVVKPASNYAQAIKHSLAGERLVISGQLGIRPDGTLEQGIEKQMERAWTNVLAVMAAAGFETQHMVKATIFVTEPGHTAVYRQIRDRMLAGHACAMTYVQIAGLASPEFLVEIEAEAVKG